jgi:hypothetical protein
MSTSVVDRVEAIRLRSRERLLDALVIGRMGVVHKLLPLVSERRDWRTNIGSLLADRTRRSPRAVDRRSRVV